MADLKTALKDRDALVKDIREVQTQYYEYRKDLVGDMQTLLKDAGVFDQFQELETEIEESKQAAQKKLDGLLEELKTLEKVIAYLQKDESISTEAPKEEAEEAPEEEAPEEEASAEESEEAPEEAEEAPEECEDEDCEDEDCGEPAPKDEEVAPPAKPKRKRPKF